MRLMTRGVSHIPQTALETAERELRNRAERMAAEAGPGAWPRYGRWEETVETVPDKLSHDLLTVVTIAASVDIMRN